MLAARRARWVRLTTVLAAGAALLIARPQWLTHPIFGPLPIFDGLPALPSPWDALVHGLLVVLLVPALIARRPKPYLLAWCALFLLRVGWDRLLWQPYWLQYVFLLGALAFFPWEDSSAQGKAERKKTERRGELVLHACRLVIAATYFWAGLCKVDRTFMVFGFDAIFGPVFTKLSLPMPPFGGFVAPIVELALGIGLLTRRFRDAAVWGAVGMHVTILLLVGVGLGIQPIIWPWNLAMAALAFTLFHGDRDTRARDVLLPSKLRLHWVGVLAFIASPALFHVGVGDPYLALRIYSFQVHEGILLLTDGTVERLPERSREVVREHCQPIEGGVRVRIEDWSAFELRAYVSPAAGNFEAIAAKACAFEEQPGTVKLVLHDPPHRITGDTRMKLLTCEQLGAR